MKQPHAPLILFALTLVFPDSELIDILRENLEWVFFAAWATGKDADPTGKHF